MSLRLSSEINLGHIATSLSVAIAAITLLLTTRKDRNLRRREYADRIRNAAAETAALLDRWKQLSLRLHEDIQPIITDMDTLLVREQKIIVTRDRMWRELVACRATASQRVTDEKIEIAYVKLYGYDAHIRELFSEVTRRLRATEEEYSSELLIRMQNDVLRLEQAEQPYHSAQLGNKLRATVHEVKNELDEALEQVIASLRNRLIRLTEAGDRALTAGKKL